MNDINKIRTTFVEIGDRTITVKRLGLIKYSQLTSSISTIIDSIVEFFEDQKSLIETKTEVENKGNALAALVTKLVDKNLQAVIQFIIVCVPEVSIKDFDENIGLEELINLVEAILLVNNINGAMDKGKKLWMDLLGKAIQTQPNQ